MSLDNVTLRAATLDDLAGIAAIYNQLWCNTLRNRGDVEAADFCARFNIAMQLQRSPIALVAEAEGRWSLLGVRVIHRFGRLVPGERIVFVGVAGSHRGEAFAACEFIMDYLKTRAPFWKKEDTPDGGRWVDAREADDGFAVGFFREARLDRLPVGETERARERGGARLVGSLTARREGPTPSQQRLSRQDVAFEQQMQVDVQRPDDDNSRHRESLL